MRQAFESAIGVYGREKQNMAKKKRADDQLSHPEWMDRELRRLKAMSEPGYREALLNASFVEGTVRNNSKSTRRDFYHDIEWLHIHKKITDEERDVLHEVREARNRLVHDIVKEEASQRQVERWRDDLANKIRKAYQTGAFLKNELLNKYISENALTEQDPAD
jgi:hypothetical protein